MGTLPTATDPTPLIACIHDGIAVVKRSVPFPALIQKQNAAADRRGERELRSTPVAACPDA
jgi:hypothetical protein